MTVTAAARGHNGDKAREGGKKGEGERERWVNAIKDPPNIRREGQREGGDGHRYVHTVVTY